MWGQENVTFWYRLLLNTGDHMGMLDIILNRVIRLNNDSIQAFNENRSMLFYVVPIDFKDVFFHIRTILKYDKMIMG